MWIGVATHRVALVARRVSGLTMRRSLRIEIGELQVAGALNSRSSRRPRAGTRYGHRPKRSAASGESRVAALPSASCRSGSQATPRPSLRQGGSCVSVQRSEGLAPPTLEAVRRREAVGRRPCRSHRVGGRSPHPWFRTCRLPRAFAYRNSRARSLRRSCRRFGVAVCAPLDPSRAPPRRPPARQRISRAAPSPRDHGRADRMYFGVAPSYRARRLRSRASIPGRSIRRSSGSRSICVGSSAENA